MLHLDAGDYLWGRPVVAPKELEQRKLKAELLAEAAGPKWLALDAMTVGDGDFAFGVDFLRDQARSHSLPYVSANIRTTEGADLFPDFKIVERGGLRIGITGLLSESRAISGIFVDPSVEAATRVVSKLKEEKVDLVVVLSHLGLTDDRLLAAEVPDIDLIFGGHSRRHQEQPAIVGETAIFQAGSRGKSLGQASFNFRGGRGFANPGAKLEIERRRAVIEKQVARFQAQVAAADEEVTKERLARVLEFNTKKLETLVVPPDDDGTRSLVVGRKVDMGRAIPDDAAMLKRVQAALEEMGPEIGGEHAGHAHGPGGHGQAQPRAKAPIGDWVGANACRACHQTQFDDWRKTSHARAYVTLVKEKRQYDLDCWSCHVTGAEQPGGPQTPSEVGHLRNVQCESCHGPGRKHVADPTVDMVRAPTEEHCKSCHSDEQTEGRFDYKKYLQKVDHLP